MITKDVGAVVINLVPHSDQVMFIQLKRNPADINIGKVYAPTADLDEESTEKSCEEFKLFYSISKKNQNLHFKMTDYSPKIGKGACGYFVGK